MNMNNLQWGSILLRNNGQGGWYSCGEGLDPQTGFKLYILKPLCSSFIRVLNQEKFSDLCYTQVGHIERNEQITCREIHNTIQGFPTEGHSYVTPAGDIFNVLAIGFFRASRADTPEMVAALKFAASGNLKFLPVNRWGSEFSS